MLLFIVRTYLVRIIGMLLFIVRAYLVRIAHKNIVLYQGNCYLVVRTWHHTVFSCHQKQRIHQPTLKKTSVLLVGCIKKSTFTSNRVHCCIHVSRVFFWGGVASSYKYIKTNISSSWVYQKQHNQQQALIPLE